MKDGFGLTAETTQLAIVTSLTLSEYGVFALLVLCHFVESVLLAISALAECASGLWYVHLDMVIVA